MKIAALFAGLLAVLSGCIGQPFEAEVTYKVIEAPYVREECTAVPISCISRDVPTDYRIELTYDKPNYGERELWCSVDPHDYERVHVGDMITVQGDCWGIDWKKETGR